MSGVRKKGVVIVDTKKGILVVSVKGRKFILPGGGARGGESRKSAAIRELYEETGLKVKEILYLFSYVGQKWHTASGKSVRDHVKVFLVKVEGIPRPRHEVKHISFWKSGSTLNITTGTERVIERYLKDYKHHKDSN